MATKKKELLIEYELEFLETKLAELKDYIEASPFSTIEDRMAWRAVKGGGTMPVCIATKEQIRKDLTQALKDYAEILRTVDSMRDKEAAKMETRGKSEMSTLAEDFIANRK